MPPAGMGIRGTFRNRSGNEAESQRERRSPCCEHAPDPCRRGSRCEGRSHGSRPVNEALTASTARLRARRESGRGASTFRASISSHAASGTRKAGKAGNVALRPGEAFPRDPRLRRQRRNLRLRSRRDPRRGAAARGHRRVEARLQPRARAARYRSCRRLR